METILDRLAAHARVRVAADQEKLPLDALKRLCEQEAASPRPAFVFEKALQKPGLSFICEVKKASPSKGVIAEEFPYREIGRAYERAGADAISCLTEPRWFLGSDEIFTEIRGDVSLPMLRKDFTVDEYQLYQAKAMGADAALLIVTLLDAQTLARYLRICDGLGLSALVEAHDERELKTAVDAGARMIGVNNRNLKDFSVDMGNSRRLRALVPEGVLFVAESGMRTAADAATLQEIGADAALVGETLMRAADKTSALARLRGETPSKTSG